MFILDLANNSSITYSSIIQSHILVMQLALYATILKTTDFIYYAISYSGHLIYTPLKEMSTSLYLFKN